MGVESMILALVPCPPCRGTGWRREVARVNVVRRVCAACEGMGLTIGVLPCPAVPGGEVG